MPPERHPLITRTKRITIQTHNTYCSDRRRWLQRDRHDTASTSTIHRRPKSQQQQHHCNASSMLTMALFNQHHPHTPTAQQTRADQPAMSTPVAHANTQARWATSTISQDTDHNMGYDAGSNTHKPRSAGLCPCEAENVAVPIRSPWRGGTLECAHYNQHDNSITTSR